MAKIFEIEHEGTIYEIEADDNTTLGQATVAFRKGFLGGYQYRRLQTSTERYTAVPDKNSYSHPHDALQYACTYYFGSGLTSPTINMADEAEFQDYARSEVTGY